MLEAVESTQVDPETAVHDKGNFLFLNLETMETKWAIPPNKRCRVNREKFRKVLLSNIKDHVYWGKHLKDIKDTDDGVCAEFADGTAFQGSMIIGAEGANSRTRQVLVPDAYKTQRLPVDLIGVAVELTPEQAKPLRDIDPLLFQGVHPSTGNYIWISMIDTPQSNGTAGTDKEIYRCQISLSWLRKDSKTSEIPDTKRERVAELKRRAVGYHPTLFNLINDIPEDADANEIVLQDWECRPWDNHGGRITLAGDAAHVMTMYRGEAANHGLLDAYILYHGIISVYSGAKSRKDIVDEYEAEMIERGKPAVLLSREACIQAHDFYGLNENSAILKKRALNNLPHIPGSS